MSFKARIAPMAITSAIVKIAVISGVCLSKVLAACALSSNEYFAATKFLSLSKSTPCLARVFVKCSKRRRAGSGESMFPPMIPNFVCPFLSKYSAIQAEASRSSMLTLERFGLSTEYAKLEIITQGI